jgi:hypothetical protein
MESSVYMNWNAAALCGQSMRHPHSNEDTNLLINNDHHSVCSPVLGKEHQNAYLQCSSLVNESRPTTPEIPCGQQTQDLGNTRCPYPFVFKLPNRTLAESMPKNTQPGECRHRRSRASDKVSSHIQSRTYICHGPRGAIW